VKASGFTTDAFARRVYVLAVALLVVFHADRSALQTLPRPDAPDVTITTRRTTNHPDSSVTTEVIYLKGARQRREAIIERPARAAGGATRSRMGITITQCDEQRMVLLNDEARTYAYVPIAANATNLMPLRSAPAGIQPREVTAGGEVTIQIDDVDTGERRPVGRYTARRVITTTTTKPGPGASTRAGVTERDAWYVDLPEANCSEGNDRPHATVLIGHAGDRVRIEPGRTVRLGYAIEETYRSRTDGGAFTTRLALVELSEAPLGEDLFTVPADYRPALRTLSGEYDLTKPDTIGNRLTSYWYSLTAWFHDFLR
jgi:hypothetical protein